MALDIQAVQDLMQMLYSTLDLMAEPKAVLIMTLQKVKQY
jgi:hypothetical protein